MLERRLAQGHDGGAVEGFVEAVILFAHLANGDTRRRHRLVEDLREIQTLRLPVIDGRLDIEQIDATPAQEKVIVQAMDEVRDEARKQREELGKTRADIAKAMRSASFDEVLLGELFARHDTVMEAMRRTVTGALAKVHVVLDEKQRDQVADLIERGPRAFRPSRRWRGYEA